MKNAILANLFALIFGVEFSMAANCQSYVRNSDWKSAYDVCSSNYKVDPFSGYAMGYLSEYKIFSTPENKSTIAGYYLRSACLGDKFSFKRYKEITNYRRSLESLCK
jgi:hypothetical protein